MERKFTIFALFYFVFEGKFQVQAPQGAYIWRRDLTECVLRYNFAGLIFGGAYFRNFTVYTFYTMKNINISRVILNSTIPPRLFVDFTKKTRINRIGLCTKIHLTHSVK